MKRLSAIALLAFSCHAWAADWYVNKAATGTGTGADWTNAWKDYNNIAFGSVACGDTIWVAGGTYTGTLTYSKVCTSGAPITIQTVLSGDTVPTSAAGWSASYLSPVINNGGNFVNSGGSYLILSGRTPCKPTITCNMQWVYTASNGVTAFSSTGSSTIHLTLSDMEIRGPSCAKTYKTGTSGPPLGTCTGSTWGLSMSSTGTDITTITGVWIHSFSEILRMTQSSWTMSDNYIGEDVYETSADHEDLIYAWGTISLSSVRDTWYSSGNDGIFFDFNTAVNPVSFINDVFVGWGYWAVSFGKSGTCGPFTFLNDTIVNDSLGSDGLGNEYAYGVIDSGGCTIAAASKSINNILYNTSQPFSSTQATYNAGTTSNGFAFSCGTGCFSYSLASPIQNFNGFVNFSPRTGGTPSLVDMTALDLHLSTAGKSLFQGKGTNLSSMCGTYPDLCTDKDGNPRPSSGAWDLGAYQAVSVATGTRRRASVVNQ